MGELIKIIKTNSNFILRIIYFFIGLFIIAFIYNAVFVPNNIVVGGISGLAIIIKELTGLSTTIFINICNVILVIFSFIILGKKETVAQLFGCITYPLMITFTEPLAQMVTFNFDSLLLLLIISSLIFGLGNGIVYRAGFSTGGTDILSQMLSRKLKMPITYFSPIIYNTIIISSAIVFSPVLVMYAVMIIIISNKVTNFVLFSIKTNKMVYVISKKNKDIENYIMNKIHTGATEIRVHSGLFEKKKQMLMCVVHNAQYRKFKQNILKMDESAFILAKDCYEVNGGIKYNILPF